jgi:NAD(P)-dependent dehydrogenase (short-subunit alcohol dehydrogenase family)
MVSTSYFWGFGLEWARNLPAKQLNSGVFMDRVSNKIALVTGAAQGLGEAICKLLLKEGAKVVATDINIDKLTAWSKDYGDKILALKHDVTKEDEWQAAINQTRECFGKLHIVVNNAGIGTMGSFEDMDFATWKKVHEVDLDSVFLGCKLSLALLEESCQGTERGSIINISSVAGITADKDMAAYNSAKAGVRNLSKSVALHCAKKRNQIRCNSLHPVFIKTPMVDSMNVMTGGDTDLLYKQLSRNIPLGIIGEPDDVAYGVLYLASDEAKFVTGTELVIDGGMLAR